MLAVLGAFKEAFNNWHGDFAELKTDSRWKKTFVGSIIEIGLLAFTIAALATQVKSTTAPQLMYLVSVVTTSFVIVVLTITEDKYKRFNSGKPNRIILFLFPVLSVIFNIIAIYVMDRSWGIFLIGGVVLAVGIGLAFYSRNIIIFRFTLVVAPIFILIMILTSIDYEYFELYDGFDRAIDITLLTILLQETSTLNRLSKQRQ